MSSGSLNDEITLGQLLDRSVAAYDRVSNHDCPMEGSVQFDILSTLSDLALCASLISRLAILSPNESLEDINTNDLKCLAVEALRGMLRLLLKTKGGMERKETLEFAKAHLHRFTNSFESYEIVPRDQLKQLKGPLNSVQDPSRRRQMKIDQYKLEKQLKARLDYYKARRTQRNGSISASGEVQDDSTSHQCQNVTAQGAGDDEDDEAERRQAYLSWLQFLYLKAHQELASIELELDLLVQGPQFSELHPDQQKRDDDLSWRLDRLAPDNQGRLISPSGKVLRPFTILPSQVSASSAATNRVRLRAEVFRPGWNLPVMTIDEYLDEQKAMGNFLSGGGPAQAQNETQGDRDRREAEEDNWAGEMKHEELRKKAIEWNEFTDSHRKGEGNMMNRG